MDEPQLTESEVRAMRDIVYERPSTDWNWEGCREHWMREDSIAWLKEKSNTPEQNPK